MFGQWLINHSSFHQSTITLLNFLFYTQLVKNNFYFYSFYSIKRDYGLLKRQHKLSMNLRISLYHLLIYITLMGIFNHADSASPPFSGDLPWMTGPLITPSARIIPKDHINVEPYLFWIQANGRYNNHGSPSSTPKRNSLIWQLPIKFGVSKNVDISTLVQSHYTWNKNASSGGIGDIRLGFSYQLFNDNNKYPPVKIYIHEVFPIGKYERLNPSNFHTDARGLGSYITVTGIVVGKLFHFGGEHYLNTRYNVSAAIPSSVIVRGINTYGGDIETKGKVFPGKSLTILLAGEFSLTRHWVLAMDLTAFFSSKTKFKGRTILPIKHPSAFQFTATPSIEYNFTKRFGLIVGAWFTFAGKNSDRFIGAAGALNYYF